MCVRQSAASRPPSTQPGHCLNLPSYTELHLLVEAPSLNAPGAGSPFGCGSAREAMSGVYAPARRFSAAFCTRCRSAARSLLEPSELHLLVESPSLKAPGAGSLISCGSAPREAMPGVYVV